MDGAIDQLQDQHTLDQVNSIFRACDVLAASFEAEAHALVREFRTVRQQLQREAELEATARRPHGSAPVRFYAKLSLFARFHNCSLQCYWQEVHSSKKKTSQPLYRYLRQGRGVGYDLVKLLASACPFEKDLVRETERRASSIRAKWRDMVAVRAAARQLRPPAAPRRQAPDLPARQVVHPASEIEASQPEDSVRFEAAGFR